MSTNSAPKWRRKKIITHWGYWFKRFSSEDLNLIDELDRHALEHRRYYIHADIQQVVKENP